MILCDSMLTAEIAWFEHFLLNVDNRYELLRENNYNINVDKTISLKVTNETASIFFSVSMIIIFY